MTHKAQVKGANSRKKKAFENLNNIRAYEFIKSINNLEKLTYAQLTKMLNDNNFLTSKGKKQTPCSVWLLCKRYDLKNN